MRRKNFTPQKIFLTALFLFLLHTLSAAEDTDKERANIEKGVQEALTLKEAGFSADTVIEILVRNPDFRFGSADLNAEQMARLKKEFDEDFIKNWAGVPQFVTVGVAAIYLSDANKMTGGAILRILTPPRSYYSELNVWPWSPIRHKPEKGSFFERLKYNIDPVHHDAWIHRFDLNFGITSTTGTDNVEAGNFVLAGFSFQIHRAAFLNFGYAFSTTGTFKDTAQGYIGITVDSNILRTVGLID